MFIQCNLKKSLGSLIFFIEKISHHRDERLKCVIFIFFVASVKSPLIFFQLNIRKRTIVSFSDSGTFYVETRGTIQINLYMLSDSA